MANRQAICRSQGGERNSIVPRRAPVAKSTTMSWRSLSGRTNSRTRRSVPAVIASIRASRGMSIVVEANERGKLPPCDNLPMTIATKIAKPLISATPITTTRILRERILLCPERRLCSCTTESAVMTAEPAALGGIATTVLAGASEAGQRLDRALARQLPALSRTRLKRLIHDGYVTCEGTALRDPALRVRCGQKFVVIRPDNIDAAPIGQPIALNVRFEDAHLIVIDKPAGLVVHPAPGNPDGTLVNALISHCGVGLSGIGGVCRPGIVHRLDKNTSGLMVVAKTEATHHALSLDFMLRRVDRAYAAIVWGVPTPLTGEIASNIGRSSANRKKMTVVPEGSGKPAITHYRVERSFRSQAALVECRLGTGRTHQVRVHLAHRGHPLIGDPIYGTRAGRAVKRDGALGARIAAFPRQALHARLLGFTHPAGCGRLSFVSALPADLRELLDNLEQL